jgi:twitching motility protein PilI
MPGLFMGVVNLRGGVGVVDLGAFRSMRRRHIAVIWRRASAGLWHSSDTLSINCVVLIDKLLGLKSVESFVASKPPAADAPEFFGHSYVDSQGAAWQEINLQALSLNPQFLSISA